MRFKRFTAGRVAAVMAVTAVATPLGDNLPAVRDSVSLTASAASWPSDYRYWSQAASDNSMMRSYGCWVVAQAKLLQEIGATPSGFNPDSYLNWEKSNGYINSNFNQVNGVNAPCKYAQQQGKSLSYLGATSSNITSKIWDNINNGYYSIIYVKTSAGSSHYVMIGNALSKSNNAIWVYNSNTAQSSAKPTSLSSKNYTLKEVYTYKSGSTPSTDNVKLLNTSSHYTDEVYSDNAIVHGEVNKPTSYPVTRIGIQVRKDGDSYSNGWSRFDNTQKTYTNSSWMSPWFNIKTELGVTLVHCTRYYYRFYAVVNGKEYWSSENTFVTTGSHSYGSWYTKTSATCTSGGTEERKCSCGVTESRSTSALGHNYGSTYFEAAHPHKYAHLCQRCGYKEFTGGNLAIYEKCDICYNENLPGKPSLNISSNGFNETDNVSFTWNDTEKTTHYVLTVAVLSGDEYKTVCRETYVNSGFQTTFGKGQYRALLQSYNSNMFHQYSSDWRDWVHNNSEYVYFNIDCAHEYLGEVVSPTFDREGYTQYTCTKCGDSYISDYTAKLTLSKVTNFKVKSLTSTNVTLQWNKNTSASGYEIEQYKDSKWVKIATVDKNSTVRYTVKGLKAGTAGYQFRIRAYRNESSGKVYSGYSVTVKVNTNPYGVGGFKCSSKTSTSVTLKWNKGTTASGYQLQQYKNGKWVTIYTGTKATNTSYTVKGLKAGTAGYRFRIRAYKTYGSSKQYGSWSSEVKVNTNPYGVGGFKAKSTAKNSITLGWNKGTTASGYQLQQYKGGKWVTVYTGTKATSTSYTIKSLKSNTSYKFRIRAYKTYGNTKQYGSWSKELTVKTKK